MRLETKSAATLSRRTTHGAASVSLRSISDHRSDAAAWSVFWRAPARAIAASMRRSQNPGSFPLALGSRWMDRSALAHQHAERLLPGRRQIVAPQRLREL